MKNFDVENVFQYHAPRPDQLPRYEAIRAKAREFAQLLDVSCPNSREKSTAFTQLQNAVMWANGSIAINESGAEIAAAPPVTTTTGQDTPGQPIGSLDVPPAAPPIAEPSDPPPASQPDPVVAAVEA